SEQSATSARSASAELERDSPDQQTEGRVSLRRRQRLPRPSTSVQLEPVDVSTQRLGTSRRIRTPLPASDHPQQSVGIGEELEGRSANLMAQKLQEKAAQFRHVQEFLQNPAPFGELRRREVGTSSTPEEIESRKGEIRYQMQIMESVVAVLRDELKELEQARARPHWKSDQVPPTHS